MMALAFGPTSCSSGLVPKSELLHSPAAQYGFVPKHSHHGGNRSALPLLPLDLWSLATIGTQERRNAD